MQKTLLQLIDSPADLRQLNKDDLPQLARELRRFIIDIVATKQGHLGASLGVIELTIALHYFFNTPEDQLIWDVGHQAYGHKILTGRRDLFDTNRQLGGISGFPKRNESNYDTFGVGHSSTSISAGLGMAISAQLQGKNQATIAVIGDAAIASGMAFEGLNHAGITNANLWIILNDNSIGIDPSVGALKHYLQNAKLNKSAQDNIFEALNFTYKGPIDGHDFDAIFTAFEDLKNCEGPKFIHLVTTKGKGLKQAEEQQITYHAPGKFDKDTGELIKKDTSQLPPKFQDVFGHTLVELAQQNGKIVGITAAMPTGTSLKYMMQQFPNRAFDVGIAEQHAVTLAAGMCTQGQVVFCAIYSTFLQRAYDQIIHDIALQNLPVIFCIDRAGLVGEDGATHHGVFDLAYLRCVPNLIIAAPADAIELRQLLYTASLGLNHPIAIRYPRGRGHIKQWQVPFKKLCIGKGRQFKTGSRIAVISLGTIAYNVNEAIKQLVDNSLVAHFDLRFLKPLDTGLLDQIFENYQTIITVEDGVISGGLGDAICDFAQRQSFLNKIIKLGIPDKFIEHGKVEELQELAGISSSKINEILKREIALLQHK